MSIVFPTTSLFWVQLDKRIDSHDRYTSLDGALQLLDFTHTRLQHTRLDTIVDSAFHEIEPIVLVVFGFRQCLSLGILS